MVGDRIKVQTGRKNIVGRAHNAKTEILFIGDVFRKGGDSVRYSI